MIFLNFLLASGSTLSSVKALPWWVQLLIGVTLLLGGVILGKINERKDVDSEAVELVAFVMKLAAVFLVVYALL
ncbi:hypothetical protein ABT160_38145 [Streptomyces sp. NPDC001941]|uniref:hypothetical protein n=1 Tax=Streptomyces sp. NPDC001941 TaxID=3154659 RepID=UPI00332FC619